MRFYSLLTLVFATIVSAAPVTTTTNSLVDTYTHCNRPGVFALTFDDGPFQYSWDLAKYLHSVGVKATFFINGDNWVKDFRTATTNTSDGTRSYMDVIKYYHELGHEIASHTYGHVPLRGLTAAQVEYQMNQLSDLVYEAIALRPSFMRPPEGVLDEAASQVVKRLGYSSIMWDVDTKDYELKGMTSEQELVRSVVEADIAVQTNGHISLQHDVHEHSAKVLTPWMIEYVHSKNYTFVTVSECLGISAYHS
ncbi:chitin deacetylase [Rhizopus stolonifer]|uniref:Chitin deacetylase n=2 Tax=Mucorineae TaxID=1344963 RepID=A0A367ITY8_RHIST|nr:chitin deacetylase [Rhizopus stolonifer]